MPAGVRVPEPIYVIGGSLAVEGEVESDLIQLAGTMTVEDGARVGDEQIAGTLVVSPGTDVGRRTSIELPTTRGDPAGGLIATVMSMLLLAGVAYLLARRRSGALDNVAAAVTGHPLITFTVGLLLGLTAVSVLVFMAFTLVLIPVAVLGILAGVVTLVHGLVAWGYLIGCRLPVRNARLGTALGAAGVIGGLRVAGLIPLLGDLIVAVVFLTGLGALVVTFFGVSRCPGRLTRKTTGLGRSHPGLSALAAPGQTGAQWRRLIPRARYSSHKAGI